jgi:uncharacterized protein YndB with AHSA1/START domain
MTDAIPPTIPEPTGTPDPERREIRLEIEVPGTIQEVWDAIATGPGITSWYVPHTLEEREGGKATASFGAGPEMQVAGRIAVWEPPHRIVFTGDTGEPGLAFEWLVEARDHGICVVRLVNSGFGDGNPWDEQYDDMLGGWKLFLRNLWLHRTYFAGRHGTPALPMGMWSGAPVEAWPQVLAALGLPPAPQPGNQVATAGDDVPRLAGTVLDVRPGSLALLLEQPGPGTGIVAVERHGEVSGVSLWVYLYGSGAPALAAAHEAHVSEWLAQQVA